MVIDSQLNEYSLNYFSFFSLELIIHFEHVSKLEEKKKTIIHVMGIWHFHTKFMKCRKGEYLEWL